MVMLAAIAMLVDWGGFLALFRGGRPADYVIATASYGLVILMRGMRFAVLLSGRIDTATPWLAGVHTASIGTFGNHVLPMRMGEIVFVVLPRLACAAPLERAATALLVARLCDVLCVLALGMVGLALLGIGLPVWGYGVLAALWLACAAAVVLLPAAVGLAGAGLARAERRAGPRVGRRLAAAGPVLARLQTAAVLMRRPGPVAFALAASVVVWVALAAHFFYLLRAFGIPATAPQVLVGMTAPQFVQMLPIHTVGNLGTYEAGWTAGFVFAGLPVDQAAASALATHLFDILLSGVLALASWAAVGRRVRLALTERQRHGAGG
jgi:uncharacterized membrane protein YbhN (UPF0104 family)